mgnify:FL=1
MDRKKSPVNRMLEEAADVVRRCKEAAGDAEPTEGYKKSQIEELKKYADTNQLWFTFENVSVIYY